MIKCICYVCVIIFILINTSDNGMILKNSDINAIKAILLTNF